MNKIIVNRDKNIDVLRGFGILIMIMGHVGFGTIFTHYKVAFNMPLFLLISGYLWKRPAVKFGQYLREKSRSIILPYFFFAAITFVFCIAVNIITNRTIYQLVCFIKGILWSNQEIFPITGAIWFLQSLFWVELIYFFLSKMSFVMKNGIIVLFSVVALCLEQFDVSLPFSFDSALTLLVFFHVGFSIRRSIEKRNLKASVNIFVILGVLVLNAALILFFPEVNPRTCSYGNYYMYYLNAITATAFFYLLFIVLSKSIFRVLLKPLEIMGKYSLVFLGLNQLIVLCFKTIYDVTIKTSGPGLMLIRSISITIVSCFVLFGLAYVLYNSKMRILIGQKNSFGREKDEK